MSILFSPPVKNKFASLHNNTNSFALWSVGAIEDDDLAWVIADHSPQPLIQETYQRLRAVVAFQNIAIAQGGDTGRRSAPNSRA
ncbi:hypothetical protein Lepto7375DRAFT_7432 [Leptolyngbya sp. PCC 7375]|nr:hypothetical protein Lepto7375DRAFT_7432 [Leptolyngbya sp. PCC 7375]